MATEPLRTTVLLGASATSRADTPATAPRPMATAAFWSMPSASVKVTPRAAASSGISTGAVRTCGGMRASVSAAV